MISLLALIEEINTKKGRGYKLHRVCCLGIPNH